jgi:hypothetical protein
VSVKAGAGGKGGYRSARFFTDAVCGRRSTLDQQCPPAGSVLAARVGADRTSSAHTCWFETGGCQRQDARQVLNDPKALEKARQALGSGMGINKVARQVGLSNSTVARVKAEMIASP